MAKFQFFVVLALFTLATVSSIKTSETRDPDSDKFFSARRLPEPDVGEVKLAKRYVFLEKLAELKSADEAVSDANSSLRRTKRQLFGGGLGGGYGGGFGGGLQELGREAVLLERELEYDLGLGGGYNGRGYGGLGYGGSGYGGGLGYGGLYKRADYPATDVLKSRSKRQLFGGGYGGHGFGGHGFGGHGFGGHGFGGRGYGGLHRRADTPSTDVVQSQILEADYVNGQQGEELASRIRELEGEEALVQEELALSKRGDFGLGRLYNRVDSNPDLVKPEDDSSLGVVADRTKRQIYGDGLERGLLIGELAERIRELETEEVILEQELDYELGIGRRGYGGVGGGFYKRADSPSSVRSKRQIYGGGYGGGLQGRHDDRYVGELASRIRDLEREEALLKEELVLTERNHGHGGFGGGGGGGYLDRNLGGRQLHGGYPGRGIY